MIGQFLNNYVAMNAALTDKEWLETAFEPP